MLRSHNWARWFALAWIAFHVILSAYRACRKASPRRILAKPDSPVFPRIWKFYVPAPDMWRSEPEAVDLPCMASGMRLPFTFLLALKSHPTL